LLKKRAEEKGERRDAVETTGELTLEELSRVLREHSPNGLRIESFDDGSLMENLHLANASYDKNVPGEPTSGRRVVGPAFAVLKRFVRRVTSWYVRPALDNQRLFNAYVTRSINEMKRYLNHLQINEDILSTVMHRDLALFRANVLFLNRHIEGRMLDFERELDILRSSGAPAGPRARDDAGPDGGRDGEDILSSLDVLTLEQRIHGSPRMVQDRQRVYLQYFDGRSKVLALGCGRGELLQLLAREGISARGTETNATMVSYCRDNELDVIKAEPLQYLESFEDASLDGVVLSRFAGHQSPARLIRMLNLCRQKLAAGAVLLVEAPNPFSLYTVASYALDDADRMHPLHPETLRLLCVTLGFQDPEVMFLNPRPPEEHLEELELTASGAVLEPMQQELFHQVNQNFSKLNRILFSHSDYTVMARCPSGDLD
jgi:SAM-dependent methyltransferase